MNNNDDYLSMKNMMEMAMGFSMANLFQKAMENSFENTRLKPENEKRPPKYIYAIIDGQQAGPFSPGEIMEYIRTGKITLETYMWKPGMPGWKLAKDIEDIAPDINLLPPETPQNDTL